MSVLGFACWSCIELVSLTQISEQSFVQSGGSDDFGGCDMVTFKKLHELNARATEEVADNTGNHGVANIGKLDPWFVVVRFRPEGSIEKSLEIEPVENCHHR